MEIIKNHKGGSKLLCGSYMYTKKKESKRLHNLYTDIRDGRKSVEVTWRE